MPTTQMANMELELEPENPLSSSDTNGVQFSLHFIDELERKRDPDSRLRTVVRSRARKSSLLYQRTRSVVNTPSIHLSPPLGRLGDVTESKNEVDLPSSSSTLGNGIARSEDICLSMPTAKAKVGLITASNSGHYS